jgi:hypothetical protein
MRPLASWDRRERLGDSFEKWTLASCRKLQNAHPKFVALEPSTSWVHMPEITGESPDCFALACLFAARCGGINAADVEGAGAADQTLGRWPEEITDSKWSADVVIVPGRDR